MFQAMQFRTKIQPSTAEKFFRHRANCTILFTVLLLGMLTIFETDLFKQEQHISTAGWTLVLIMYTGMLVCGAYLFKGVPRRFVTFILVANTALTLFVFYAAGVTLNLDKGFTERTRYHAIPVAISQLYHGRPHNYTGYLETAIPFQLQGDIQALIDKAVQTTPINPTRIYFWAADDRGFSDLIYFSFALFGPHVRSIYYGYIIIFTVSLLIAILAFRKYPAAIAILLLFLCGYYYFIHILPTASPVPGYYIHISESRTLEIAGLVFVLHGVLFLIFKPCEQRRGIFDLAMLTISSVIFVFWYHARSSLGWEIFAIAIIALIHLMSARLRIGNSPHWQTAIQQFRHPVMIIAVTAISLAGLSIYKRAVYPPEYYNQSGSRTFWHNALMGIYIPSLQLEYSLGGPDDRATIEAVLIYGRKNSIFKATDTSSSTDFLDSLGGHTQVNWLLYEDAARSFYFSLWRQHFKSMLINYAYYKFSSLKAALLQHLQPFKYIFCLLAYIPSLVLFVSTTKTQLTLLFTAGLLLLFASIPGIMFYPVILTMSALYTLSILFIFILFVTSIKLILEYLHLKIDSDDFNTSPPIAAK